MSDALNEWRAERFQGINASDPGLVIDISRYGNGEKHGGDQQGTEKFYKGEPLIKN